MDNNTKENVVSLRYLIPHVPGVSMEKLELIFKSDEEVEKFLNEVKDNYEILTIFHDCYSRLKNKKISINEGLIRRIKLIDDLYYDFLKNENDLSSRIENSVILSDEEVKKKLKKRINKMSKNGINGFPFSEEVIGQRTQEGTFSFNRIFEIDNLEEVNGVTVITPTQTISRFSSKDGLIGGGWHPTTFDEISRSVYGRQFNEEEYQDIRVRYTSMVNDNYIRIIIQVPFPINSTQKKSLEFLNNEIKNFENETGCVIDVIAGVTEGMTNTPIYHMDYYSPNLDEFLDKVIVDDNFKPKYNELYLVGHPNDENHYNDSLHRIKNTNDARIRR